MKVFPDGREAEASSKMTFFMLSTFEFLPYVEV